MGNYLNPESRAFYQAVNSEIYVDKTGLLKFLNKKLGTEAKCIAVSHARRFGKSQAAGMIDAYYSKVGDAKELFANFEIAQASGWDRYLNKFNVIHLDMATFINAYKPDPVSALKQVLYDELVQAYPELTDFADISRPLPFILNYAYKIAACQFVIIIDEWDAVIRNYPDNQELVHDYMALLHDIFKSEESKTFLALGYMTGILPIKKIKDESALNNFIEFTMVSSSPVTEYFGFTEDDVKALCAKYDMNFDSVQKWYDGYLIDGIHMYNPNSVYCALTMQKLDSYWKHTASFESINAFITLNMDGLKEDVLEMLSGRRVFVNVNSFKNDLNSIRNKSEALTALIHLGYLAYDAEMSEAFIPNYEVATAYQAALVDSSWSEVANSIELASKALNALINAEADEFARYIDLAHEAYTSIKDYNNENSLYSVLYMTLFTAKAYYNVEREFPSGKGFADMVLIPRKDAGNKPAVVLELKYDKTADSAIRQIKEKRYAGKLSAYSDKVLLAGINYDKDTKKHECIIEEMKL